MIFDTNILIYLSKDVLSLDTILTEKASISVITKIEALGYRFENEVERKLILDICGVLPVIPLTDEIADRAIELRSVHKIKLADAIIYATALVEDQPLMTNNTDDFKKLSGGVKLIDPFKL